MESYNQAVALWQSCQIDTAADLDKYLNNFRILFAYHSGKIENDEVTWQDTREIFENGRVEAFSGDPRTLFEQQNQKICYEFLKQKIAEKTPLSVELVREVHRVLTAGTYDERRYIANEERPGEFKKRDYVTGIHEVGSAVDNVEGDLAALIDEMNLYDRGDVLKAGAYFHAGFEYIHPFADGNGRVGRTLLNYFLMIHGHPPLIVYNEDKGEYYAALQAYDEAEDLEPLYDFLKRQTIRTWAKTLELRRGERSERKNLNDFTQEG